MRSLLWAQHEAKPWLEQLARIQLVARPTWLLTADGLKQVDDGLTPHQRELVQTCNDMLSYIYQTALQDECTARRRL